MKPLQFDSFIYFDEYQVARNQAIPHRVCFKLNQNNLPTILQAQKSDRSFDISTENLTNLRYYALFSYFYSRSPLVFVTNYSRGRETIAIVKSTISPEGKISQQIRKDAINNPQLFRQLIKTHHWLLLQVLSQLPLKLPLLYKWLLLVIILSVSLPIALSIFYFLPISNLLKVIVTILAIVSLGTITNYVIKDKLPTWILHQLLEGILASKLQTRKIGIWLLGIAANTKP